MPRLTSQALAVLLVLGAMVPLAGDVAAQDGLEASVKQFMTKAGELCAYGRDAAKYLRRSAGKNKEVEFVLHELKRQARKNRKKSGLSAEELQKHVAEFITLAKAVTAHGEAASDALEAKAAAAEDPLDQALLRKVGEAIYITKARTAIKPFLNKGSFLGMYDELLPQKARMLQAFKTLFLNRDDDEAECNLAAEGVAQFAKPKDESVLTELREVEKDVSEPKYIRDTARKVMARLGDRSPLEAYLKDLKDQIAQEMKAEQPRPGLLLSNHNTIAFTHQTIGEYKPAIAHFVQFAQVLLSMRYDKLPVEWKGVAAGAFYNLACAASRIKAEDVALWGMNQHFNYGGTSFEWARADGDLEWLRDNGDGFENIMKHWKEGKTKPGEWTFDKEAFGKALQSTLGGGQAQPEEKKEPAGEATP